MGESGRRANHVLIPSAAIESEAAGGTIWSALAIAWFRLNAGPFIGEFRGWAGGGTVAEGPFSGTLYSDSFVVLGRDTTNFKFWLAVAYTRIWFYDANSVRLGAFEGNALGVVGFGLGPGKWGGTDIDGAPDRGR